MNKGQRRFFLGIVLPSIFAMCLFIVAIFFIIIPNFEKNMMERKKEMISELVNTAWSLVHEYGEISESDSLQNLEELKDLAAQRIENMRYGPEAKDYFWIIDTQPEMVMHPYRPELNGENLRDFTDTEGKKLFVEAVQLVKNQDQGFVDYFWQWKDDSLRNVPKLSYVKIYRPWNWVIGTGIYLDDVAREIESIETKFIRLSLLIIVIIIIILFVIIRQSSLIESRRKKVEDWLKQSREKYRLLVNASTEETLIVSNGKIIFANQVFQKNYGYPDLEDFNPEIERLFSVQWKKVVSQLNKPGDSASVESSLKSSDGSIKTVILNISRIIYKGVESYILNIQNLNPGRQLQRACDAFGADMKNHLAQQQQKIDAFIEDAILLQPETEIHSAIEIMERKAQSVFLVGSENRIIGIVTDNDIRNRFSLSKNIKTKVSELISSPVFSIKKGNSLNNAFGVFQSKDINYLPVFNEGGSLVGMLNKLSLLSHSVGFVSVLQSQIKEAKSINDYINVFNKSVYYFNSLLKSGVRATNVCRSFSEISDSITKEIIESNVEILGEPPCKFAFIALGSEGRMEQTIYTDQDNAIIFEQRSDRENEIAKEYFVKLGKAVNKELDAIGYRFCDGEVMAGNPKWCQSIDAWTRIFAKWFRDSTPEAVLDVSIFLDFRFVFGEENLVSELYNFIRYDIKNKALFLQHLSSGVSKFRSPLGRFGGLVGNETEENIHVLDIKKIIFPIISFLRLYALKESVMEQNSLDRVEVLQQKDVLSGMLASELAYSMEFLTFQRLRFQIEDFLNNKNPSNKIALEKLTEIEKTTLRKIINEISTLQTKVNFDFKGNAI